MALAVAVGLGAWWRPGVPLLAGPALAALAFAVRRPWVLVVGAAALAASLADRAWDGMDPMARASFEGTVTLVSDPDPMPYGERADVRIDGHRLELVATGGAAGALALAQAGERLHVVGRIAPPPDHAPWLVPRHVVGRLTVDRAELVDHGSLPFRAANRLRRSLARGAEALPASHRALYAGFVVGDDRALTPEVIDDFRGAGLTHVLVVSGQNLAFVLVLASPLLGRLSWGARWACTLVVIGAFATVTRFEPSVLRASAMAAAAVSAGALGRPASTVRTLALGVSAIVLVDPLLVHSVGFQLSVAASAAIALLARPIADALPGPRALAAALGVTLAAQVGVAPLLIPRFGGVPVASIPANLVAVPVAGLVTSWGLPAGLVAGAFGGVVATVAHLPTQLMITWVAEVARTAAALPLGELGLGAVVALGALGLLAVRSPRWLRRIPHGVLRRVAGVGILLVLVAPGWALRSPPPVSEVAGSVALHRQRGATVVEVPVPVRAADLLEGLRRAGVRRIDVLRLGPEVERSTVDLLAHRWTIGRVEVEAPPEDVGGGG